MYSHIFYTSIGLTKPAIDTFPTKGLCLFQLALLGLLSETKYLALTSVPPLQHAHTCVRGIILPLALVSLALL